MVGLREGELAFFNGVVPGRLSLFRGWPYIHVHLGGTS